MIDLIVAEGEAAEPAVYYRLCPKCKGDRSTTCEECDDTGDEAFKAEATVVKEHCNSLNGYVAEFRKRNDEISAKERTLRNALVKNLEKISQEFIVKSKNAKAVRKRSKMRDWKHENALSSAERHAKI